MVSRGEVTVVNEPGLHTRPASMLAGLAARFRSRITLSDHSAQSVDCKSIMGILMLAAITGTQLTVRAEGDDADEAVRALVRLIGSGFDEIVLEDEKMRAGRSGS
jgi:phosphotransferase system HPr (HPr) family protein